MIGARATARTGWPRPPPPSGTGPLTFVRVASILVVVAGHWLMAVVTWRDGRVEGGNALLLVFKRWPPGCSR